MHSSQPLRLAMWSGPRNISTAMMRSWGNRDDTVVCDEPLYAHYLWATHKAHPGRDEVIAAGETDWRKVVAQLVTGQVGGNRIYYQKHMTHHVLSQMERTWLLKLTNCFLIRNPREVLASYAKVVEAPSIDDTGFPQQAEIFAFVSDATGQTPPVIDAADVLTNPRRVLSRLCDALNVDFQETMLSWSAGPRATDGVWAKHWYAEVHKSTEFRPYQPKSIELPPRLAQIAEACMPFYERLSAHRIH